MAVKIVLDREAVRRVPQDLVRPLVDKTARKVHRGALSTVRVRTGAVRAGIAVTRSTTATKVSSTITAHHGRSLLEHEGSPRHPIRQRPGGPLLTFFWRRVGRVVHFHSVKHPGTKGSKFLTKPLVKFGKRAGFEVTITPGAGSGTITP